MLTPDELERRRQFLTATDVPRMLRRTPPAWGNEADVYLEKVLGITKPPNEAMRAGSLLEPSILAWASEEIGGVIPGDWRVHENGINACSLDGMTLDGEPVEAKTSGLVGPGTPHQWGEAGTDEIPPYYLLQVHAQLLITGQKRAWVPALIGGRGFVMFQVWRNEKVADAIRHASEQFWENHVVPKIPPQEAVPQIETLKYLRRVPGKIVPVPDELVAAFLQAQEVAKRSEEAEKEEKAALLHALGDAEGGQWSGGTITYMEQSRKEYTIKAGAYRVLRVKEVNHAMSSAAVK